MNATPQWRKSNHSGSTADSDCVEVAALAPAVGVRDSKNPAGPSLLLARPAFAALVDAIKSGHLTP